MDHRWYFRIQCDVIQSSKHPTLPLKHSGYISISSCLLVIDGRSSSTWLSMWLELFLQVPEFWTGALKLLGESAWSNWFVLSVQCRETSFSAMHAFRPRMAGPKVSVMQKMQLIFFLSYLQGMSIVPSCLITEPPSAERMASFFSSASGLGFPLSSIFSGAIMRSSLRGKTLLCAPLALEINFPLLLWLSYLKCCKEFIACVVCRWMLRVLYGVNLDGTDCQNFIIVLIVPVLNRGNNLFEGRLFSLIKLFPFAGSADWLPMISFVAFLT